jgi:hypothetical protein
MTFRTEPNTPYSEKAALEEKRTLDAYYLNGGIQEIIRSWANKPKFEGDLDAAAQDLSELDEIIGRVALKHQVAPTQAPSFAEIPKKKYERLHSTVGKELGRRYLETAGFIKPASVIYQHEIDGIILKNFDPIHEVKAIRGGFRLMAPPWNSDPLFGIPDLLAIKTLGHAPIPTFFDVAPRAGKPEFLALRHKTLLDTVTTPDALKVFSDTLDIVIQQKGKDKFEDTYADLRGALINLVINQRSRGPEIRAARAVFGRPFTANLVSLRLTEVVTLGVISGRVPQDQFWQEYDRLSTERSQE